MSMAEEPVSRRKLLGRLWLALGGVALAETVAVAVGFFRPRPPRAGADVVDAVVEAGPVERFEPGSVTAFVRWKFYLARLEDGGFMALSRNCTHLGCAVPWVADAQRFVCPCHASAFDIRGDVISPPAPRALDRFPVSIENGIVRVDTGRRIKRSEFAADQVTRPRAS